MLAINYSNCTLHLNFTIIRNIIRNISFKKSIYIYKLYFFISGISMILLLIACVEKHHRSDNYRVDFDLSEIYLYE